MDLGHSPGKQIGIYDVKMESRKYEADSEKKKWKDLVKNLKVDKKIYCNMTGSYEKVRVIATF